jgi:RNA polymerase sigma-70 factor (ECF subfamily)
MLAICFAALVEESSRNKFTKMVEKYQRLMFCVARDILKDDYLAEDAVQEAFLKVAKNFSKVGDIDSGKTKFFLVVITKNTALDMLRKELRRPDGNATRLDDLAENSVPVGTFNDIDAVDLGELIMTLPENLRSVLYLYGIYGYTFSEISNLMGLSIAAVKGRYYRARNTLAEMIKRG